MRSADLLSPYSQQSRHKHKDPLPRDKFVSYHNLIIVNMLGNGKKDRLSPRLMIIREILRNMVYNGVS
jgi:hypothetical protein